MRERLYIFASFPPADGADLNVDREKKSKGKKK